MNQAEIRMSDLNEIERGQICRTAYDSYRSTIFGLSNFPGLLKKIIRYRAWERRELVTKDGRPKGRVIELSSLRELITEKPIKGWGLDPETVESVIQDNAEALAVFRDSMGIDRRDRRVSLTGDPEQDRQRLVDVFGEDYLAGLRA